MTPRLGKFLKKPSATDAKSLMVSSQPLMIKDQMSKNQGEESKETTISSSNQSKRANDIKPTDNDIEQLILP